jgi:hypothetical protein
MRPRDGFNPTTPQHDAGMRIEPPPSPPWPSAHKPAATAAAAPPLDPPAVRVLSTGLRAGGGSSELRRVRLPEDDGTLVLEPADGEAVDLGDRLREHEGAEAVAIPCQRRRLLDRDRHAIQQAKRFASRHALFRRGGLAFRQLAGQENVGIEFRIDPPNALVVEGDELTGLDLPGSDGACLLECAFECPGVIDHPLTVSTRGNSASC